MNTHERILNKAYTSGVVRTLSALTLTLLSLFLLTLVVTEVREWRFIGSGVIPTNTITIQGEGEVFAVPDTALFSFSVIKEGESAEAVQEEAAQVTNEAIAYLKENGVEDRDIKTISYNVYPRYEWRKIQCITYPCPEGKRELVGFEINQSVQVKVRDTKKAGELLSGVGSFGVENISGLQFTIDDEDALSREARREAVADAKEKADALADDLGVRLVRIVSFNEYGSPVAYPRFESVAYGVGGDVSSKTVPDLPVGENRITSQVSITYEIQ
ncbi:MAG: SIMPL domain-containing protein [Candidatus Pacebacteria bacterium]|nr:SIMPL domain-containing protein [Candidatus Paceibacterota bacterium]